MLELIAANPLWFWLSLGGVLLAAEMLGAGGYLLWSGVAALLVGVLIWLLPQLSWAWQGAIFAVLTVVVAYLWWYWLRRRPAAASGGSPVLNQRNRQLIGTRATLTEPMHNGMGASISATAAGARRRRKICLPALKWKWWRWKGSRW